MECSPNAAHTSHKVQSTFNEEGRLQYDTVLHGDQDYQISKTLNQTLIKCELPETIFHLDDKQIIAYHS